MQVKLPAVLGVDVKSRLGRIRQIASPPTTINCRAVKYTLGKSVGHVLQNTSGKNCSIFPDASQNNAVANVEPVRLKS